MHRFLKRPKRVSLITFSVLLLQQRCEYAFSHSMIGEAVNLNNTTQVFKEWWQGLN